MPSSSQKETDLYPAIKIFLETQGYTVKAEIKDCDLVAVKGDGRQIIVELKLKFSLELVLQGVDRLALTDDVYIAVLAANTAAKRKNWRAKRKGYLKLCRRLGLGLMTVDLSKQQQQVAVLLDPLTYAPRKNKLKQSKLLKEFNDRVGDPNIGGMNRTKIITAYRQDAIRCAYGLANNKSMAVKELKLKTGVGKTAAILQKNYYGWFERVTRGVYCLSAQGLADLEANTEAVDGLCLTAQVHCGQLS